MGEIVKLSFDNTPFGEKVISGDLELIESNITLLQGKNGVGKSTLLQWIKQYSSNSEFECVFVDQKPLNSLNNISVKECFERFHKISKVELLDEFWNQPINELSGGQGQLFKILFNLSFDSDIIFFDEPLQYLDSSKVTWFVELLKEYKERGKKILLVEHRSELLEAQVDYKYILENTDIGLKLGRQNG